jgi:hypothetical protein
VSRFLYSLWQLISGAGSKWHFPKPAVISATRRTHRANTILRYSGAALSISAQGNLTEKIEKGAKVHIQVKYGIITLINQETDLCEQVGQVDLECPLDKGELKLTKDVELPKEIPPVRPKLVASHVDNG